MSIFLKLALVDTLLAVGDWYFTGCLWVTRASNKVMNHWPANVGLLTPCIPQKTIILRSSSSAPPLLFSHVSVVSLNVINQLLAVLRPVWGWLPPPLTWPGRGWEGCISGIVGGGGGCIVEPRISRRPTQAATRDSAEKLPVRAGYGAPPGDKWAEQVPRRSWAGNRVPAAEISGEGNCGASLVDCFHESVQVRIFLDIGEDFKS